MQKNTLNNIDSNKIKILICCHKACELPQDDIFLPVQVGAALTNENLGFNQDNKINNMICDNISEKNKSYCELTALYWAWKNIKKLYPDLEYIGINHYRRFFKFNSIKKNEFFDVKSESQSGQYKLDYKFIKNVMNNGNTIITQPRFYPYSLDIEYGNSHISDDMRTLKQVIHELYPEYDRTFFDVIENSNYLSPCNMTIMPFEKFDAYCNWLFSILEEAEKRINISNYTPVQKRIFGYFAERLFNIWIHKNVPDAIKLPVMWYTNENINIKEFYKTQKRNKFVFPLTLNFKYRMLYKLNSSKSGRKLLEFKKSIKDKK